MLGRGCGRGVGGGDVATGAPGTSGDAGCAAIGGGKGEGAAGCAFSAEAGDHAVNPHQATPAASTSMAAAAIHWLE